MPWFKYCALTAASHPDMFPLGAQPNILRFWAQLGQAWDVPTTSSVSTRFADGRRPSRTKERLKRI